MDNQPRIHLANLPTPVEQLERWPFPTGLYVKRDDLTGNEVSGNKIRKLEFILGQALAAGAEALITCGGIQSNHARAVAAAAARHGLACHLVLRGERPDRLESNLLLDHILGAEFTFLPAEKWSELDQVMAAVAEKYTQQGLKPWLVPMGGSNATGALGYRQAMAEVVQFEAELGQKFGLVVHAFGSAGTAAGMLMGREAFGLEARIMSLDVCGMKKRTMVRMVEQILQQGEQEYGLAQPDLSAWQPEIGGHGEGYAKVTVEEMGFYRQLARQEGLVLDPVYTGKAFRQLCRLANDWETDQLDKPVLFLHTGGLFGLFTGGSGQLLDWA